MGIRDDRYIFSAAQSAEGTPGTEDSTNTIDFGSAASGQSQVEMGEGEPLILNIDVVEVYAQGASDCVIQWNLLTSDDDSSWATLISTNAYEVELFAATILAAGSHVLKQPIPMGRMERYVKLEIITSGAAVSTGTFNAWLSIK